MEYWKSQIDGLLYYLGWGQVEQAVAVVQAHWGQHYSRVVAATADTADKAKDIVEEGTVDEEMFDVEYFKQVSYGGTGSLVGSSSIKNTKNFVGLVAVSKSSSS